MSRNNPISFMLKNIVKSQADFKRGVIEFISNGWRFGDSGTTNAQGVFLKPHKDVNGRWMSLKLGQKTAVNCPSAELYAERFPETNRGFQVPASVCRKCVYRLGGRQAGTHRAPGMSKPRCELLVKIRAGSPEPLVKAAQVLQTAVNKTEEILKGKSMPSAPPSEDENEIRRQSIMSVFGRYFIR